MNCSDTIPLPTDDYFYLRPSLDYHKIKVDVLLRNMRPAHAGVHYIDTPISVTRKPNASIRVECGKKSALLDAPTLNSQVALDKDQRIAGLVERADFVGEVHAFLSRTKAPNPVVMVMSDWYEEGQAHAMLCIFDVNARQATIMDPAGGAMDSDERGRWGGDPSKMLGNVCAVMMAAALGVKRVTILKSGFPSCSVGYATKRGGVLFEWNNALNLDQSAHAGNCQWVQLFIINTIMCHGYAALKEGYWSKKVEQMSWHVEHNKQCPAYHFNNDELGKAMAFMRLLYIRAFVSAIIEGMPEDIRRRYVGKDDRWLVFDVKTMRAAHIAHRDVGVPESLDLSMLQPTTAKRGRSRA